MAVLHSLFGCQSPTGAPGGTPWIESTAPHRRTEANIPQLTAKRRGLDQAVLRADDDAMSSFEMAGMRIEIDPETLRETVTDPAALASWCAENPEDPRTVAGLRIVGRLDEAAAAGRRALDQSGLSPVMRAVRRTRYAQVLQWQGAFLAAEEQMDLAAEETGFEDPTSPSSLSALASVFQHRAKNRFEHARAEQAADRPRAAARLWDAALEDARRALLIRERLGVADQGLLASSRQLVARLERRDLGAAEPSERSGV